MTASKEEGITLNYQQTVLMRPDTSMHQTHSSSKLSRGWREIPRLIVSSSSDSSPDSSPSKLSNSLPWQTMSPFIPGKHCKKTPGGGLTSYSLTRLVRFLKGETEDPIDPSFHSDIFLKARTSFRLTLQHKHACQQGEASSHSSLRPVKPLKKEAPRDSTSFHFITLLPSPNIHGQLHIACDETQQGAGRQDNPGCM